MWEYLTEHTIIKLTSRKIRMDQLGEEGWELVGVDQSIMYFKRRKAVVIHAGE